jgi:hypothetical protein
LHAKSVPAIDGLILIGRLVAYKNADGHWLISKESLDNWNRQRVRRSPKRGQPELGARARERSEWLSPTSARVVGARSQRREFDQDSRMKKFGPAKVVTLPGPKRENQMEKSNATLEIGLRPERMLHNASLTSRDRRLLLGAVPKEAVEAVRELSPIDQVIAQWVRLRRAGVQFVGRCPFHADKTPSFAVHPGKHVYHCHGCNAGGDVFDFVPRLHGFSFFGSVHFLAERAGIRLDGFKPSPELTARVAAARVHREEEVAFEHFCSDRIEAVNHRYRVVQDLAWHELER